MLKRTSKRDVKLPFHLGQSSDDVVRIQKKSGRACRKVIVHTIEGASDREYIYEIVPKRGTPKEIEREANRLNLNAKRARKVIRYFDDCVLTFTYGQMRDVVINTETNTPRVVESGARCWRVSQIELR